jgi:hypothetical protein
MPKLTCSGRDNIEREFEYTCVYSELDHTWDVFVKTVPPPPNDLAFELRLTPVGDNAQVTSVTHHNSPLYREKGIIDALLPTLAAELDRGIVSSPTTGEHNGEYRTVAATKYWERLRGKNAATFDEASDLYTCPKPVKPAAQAEAPNRAAHVLQVNENLPPKEGE